MSTIHEDVLQGICDSQTTRSQKFIAPQAPFKIVNQFIYEVAAKYIDNFGQVPTWHPQYSQFIAGTIEGFTYERVPL